MNKTSGSKKLVHGRFVTLDGERYYVIENVDQMPAFFISLVSDSDHWLFIASNGGLTAGRVSPETALFPYTTVDKIYDSTASTGSKTLLRVEKDGEAVVWEPFNKEHDGRYLTTRNLYKNALGNKVLFEEINHDLQLAFRYRWLCSDEYGFVRRCELENLAGVGRRAEVLDGLQNLLPAGTPRMTQTHSSYLVDAYKWNELDAPTGLAFFTLYSAITDRAEPCESLRATTVFCLGLEDGRVVLSSGQVDDFRQGAELTQEANRRGVRAAYLVNSTLELPAKGSQQWQLVANVEQSQSESVDLLRQLGDPARLADNIARSIDRGSDALARIMAAADGFQLTAEENVFTHHYANVLFNVLRGGIFDNQYLISRQHFCEHVARFNGDIYTRYRATLQALPEHLDSTALLNSLRQQGDLQLERLGYEYLPITFGRRHGDPSRPWNQFSITLKDTQGERLLSYQGNWRDIFQNWEALLVSYPEFTENVIAKFVNASTVDGYNPYRITNEGIDWEVEEPDDPWSYIGYWGDHQVIYLLKLLELSLQFHPERLGELLHRPLFSYANVPYKIKSFPDLLRDAKSTVLFDHAQAERIEQRVAAMGVDGKLLPGADGQVCQVTLLEKLLVTLLSKLGNLVIDGGIWLNTQRPEWNDANNALVGQGLSMVTLYYLRRYITLLQRLVAANVATCDLSRELVEWLDETAAALKTLRSKLGDAPIGAGERYRLLEELGTAADRYRQTVYRQESLSGPVPHDLSRVSGMLEDALAAIDHSIHTNLREDGLYHAYNLLNLGKDTIEFDSLYPMLEGQVAVLSSGAITAPQAVELVERLFDSQVFRPDQKTFLLYPDRKLPGFLEKNRVPGQAIEAIPLIATMHERGDRRIAEQDAGGSWRFNADISNAGKLDSKLDALENTYGQAVAAAREPLRALYEQVFRHKAFTGRSGGMFGFEGLGSVYWHMVSKLLLAVQENFFAAIEEKADNETCQTLAGLYYRVREGIGFNKSPSEYGAFPMDPYSHTPLHMGAQQPGMTGQVKEEILARFGELGIRVKNGAAQFEPGLLRPREFLETSRTFRFLDVSGNWTEIDVPSRGLAFTWCQVPLLYRLDDSATPSVSVLWDNGEQQQLPGLALPADVAVELFRRSGRIRQVDLVLNPGMLLAE